MVVWFQIISELFVNIAAAWFGAVFIEPQINPITSFEDFLVLILRFGVGIISLFAAKFFREKRGKRK